MMLCCAVGVPTTVMYRPWSSGSTLKVRLALAPDCRGLLRVLPSTSIATRPQRQSELAGGTVAGSFAWLPKVVAVSEFCTMPVKLTVTLLTPASGISRTRL